MTNENKELVDAVEATAVLTTVEVKRVFIPEYPEVVWYLPGPNKEEYIVVSSEPHDLNVSIVKKEKIDKILEKHTKNL
jgi:hypothetical protein